VVEAHRFLWIVSSDGERMTKLLSILHQHRTLIEITMISFGGVILTLPTIIYGFPADGHDSIVHLTWYTQFSEQLISGQTYPRWLLRENAGLGSPTFYYYGPLPYYVTSIFLFLSTWDPFGWYQVALSASLAVVLSGVAAYLWIRSRTNRRAALLAALIYMIMPYHLAIDLYERAAFTELWAFVWMPLILYFVSKMRRNYWPNVLGLAISYSFLIMTHLSTTLIFSLIPIAYSLIINEAKRRISAVFLTTAAMIWGIALSAIHLLPALGMQDYVFVGREVIKTLYLSNFLFQGSIPETTFDLKLTFVVLSMSVLAVCGIIIGNSITARVLQVEQKFWISITVLAVLMMTPLSAPIIEIIPPLHQIQFPWRYNIILVVSVSAIVAIGFSFLSRPYSPRVIGSLAISILLVTGWLLLDLRQGYVKSSPPHYVRDTTFADKKPMNEMIAGGTFTLDYRPRTVQTDLRQWADDTPQIAAEVGSQVIIEKWESRFILLAINSPEDSLITVGQLYYPGWTAQIIGQSCCLPTNPSVPDGLVTVQAPAGSYQLTLRLEPSPLEVAGQIVSFFSMILILIMFIGRRVARCGFTGTRLKIETRNVDQT
jgi:hypothetical protein